MKLTVKRLVTIALLVTVALLLKRVLTIPLPLGVFNFGGFPIIFGGLLLGAPAGAIIGGLSDIMGCILFPRGPYIPFFTVTAMLTGAIPPVILTILRQRENTPFWAIILSIAAAQILTKIIIFPILMKEYFGIPYFYTVAKCSLVELLHIPVYAILSRGILLTQKNAFINPARYKLS